MVNVGAGKPRAKRLMSYKLQPGVEVLNNASTDCQRRGWLGGRERGMMGGERPAAAFFRSQIPSADGLHGKADTGLTLFLTFILYHRGTRALSESCPLKTESTLLISHIFYVTFSQREVYFPVLQTCILYGGQQGATELIETTSSHT